MADRMCSIEGCQRSHKSRGLCSLHYQRARNEGAEVTYRAAHELVSQQRGQARHHLCVDCGAPAIEWSYNNSDPNEIVSRRTGTHYSADPKYYDPRCRRCHRAFDELRRTMDLHAMGKAVQTDIKHAIHERDRARRIKDRKLEDYWDDELERLIVPIRERIGPLA